MVKYRDDANVNIDLLKDLSVDALIVLAEKMGMDLPQGLPQSIIIEELLDAFEEDRQERRAPSSIASHVEEKKFSGSELDDLDASIDAAPCIAHLYNESLIRFIPRDSEWAFVFWDIREEEREEIFASPNYAGLCLRVYSEDAPGSPNPGSLNFHSFEIPIKEKDNQWYIQLPEADLLYRVDLCAKIGSKSRIIASSNPARSPRALIAGRFHEMDSQRRQLLVLSGLDSLQIVPVEEKHPSRIIENINME